MLNWDEFNEVEKKEEAKQVPQEVVKKAVEQTAQEAEEPVPVSYTHLRAHET